MHPNFLSCANLTVARGTPTLVHSLQLEISAGMRVGVLGPNGVGKSTLLCCLAGLWPSQHGELLLEGKPYRSWRQREAALRRSWLSQQLYWGLAMTVEEAVLLGRYPHLSFLQNLSTLDRQVAREALQQLGITHLVTRPVQHLSGGERQKVALARLLTQQAPLMFLDEPLTHLDVAHQLRVSELFVALSQQGKALVFALHEINSAARLCTHILLLQKGEEVPRWCFGKTQDVLTTDNLAKTYGCEFVEVPWREGLLYAPVTA